MPVIEKQIIKQRRKEFRKHAVPIFSIQLTRPMQINNQTYQMIGQQTTKSVIFTNYSIVNDLGHEAPADIRKKVFTYTVKLQMIESFIFIGSYIEEQSIALMVGEAQQLMAKYHEKTGGNLESLLLESEQLAEQIDKTQDELEEIILGQDVLSQKSLKIIDEQWEELRQIYEQRIPKLLSFRNFLLDEMIVGEAIPNGLDRLYEEAKIIYELFYETIPTDTAQLKDLNKFIELNGLLGHVEETQEEQNTFSKWEQFSYAFFSRITYLTVLIIALIVTLTKGLSFPITLYTGFFLIASASLHLVNNLSMINTISIRTKQQRNKRITKQQLTKETYKQTYNLDPENKTPETRIEIGIVTARNSIITIIIGAIIFMYIVLTIEEQNATESLIALAGLIIIIVGIFLPKQTPSKHKLILTGKELRLGRKKIKLEQITRIEGKRKGRKYEIYSANLSGPIKVRIPKTQTKETKSQIKSWTERHLITFEE